MNLINPHVWTEVKQIKFHHKVKRFYYKNLFRKIYTIAIIGLIGANIFSIMKYASFADEPLLEMPEQEDVVVTISPVDDDMSSRAEGEGSTQQVDEETHLASPILETEDEEIQDMGLELLDELNLVENEPEIYTQSMDNPQLVGWEYGTISIARPDGWTDADGPEGFTIMDRNLGATATGYGASAPTDSYGNYYQRGNNYGYPYNTSPTVVNTCLTWNSGYNNSGYVSKNWINGNNCNYDVWGSTSTDHYDGIWGGVSDNADNGWGANLANYSQRQGPCPSGWHVPSAGEWGLVVKYWRDTYATGVTLNGSNNLYYISNATARENFMNYFKLPFAGGRSYSNASLSNQGSYGFYWSSSPYGSGYPYYARYLYLNSSNVRADYYSSRASGFSVRCFKDSYVAPTTYTLTFDSQGGTEVASQRVEEGQNRSRPADPTHLDTDYVFVDWYTSTEYTELFDFDQEPTEDKIAYAKWRYKDCAADQEYDSVNNLCYKLDTTYTVPVYYGVDTDTSHKYNNNPIGTITVKIDNGVYSGQTLTMMNINLGATEIYNQDIYDPNTASYGDHFQWGNNYGFSQDLYKSYDTSYFSSTPVAYENDGPGRRYIGSAFRYGSNMKDYWENDMHYDNLRGGYGDDVSNNRGGIANGSERQGPCPNGYHVPSQGERNAIVTYWYNKKYPSNPKNYANLNTIDNDANFKFAFLLPRAGSRGYQAADVRNGEYDGKYWSSSPSSTSNGADVYDLHLYEMDSYSLHRIYASSYDNRTWGFSIRCFKDSSNAPEIRTITFNANGGNLLGTTNGILNQLVASGHLISQPVDPTKDGLVFDKWTTDQVGESEFDFSTPMSSSTPTILYAQYGCDDGYEKVGDNCEPQQFTVTFDANRGTITAPQTVSYGGKATQPTTTFPGYTLDGWYLDSGFNTQWNFTTNTVTGDITLYAKWSYTQTFDDLEIYFVKSDGSTGHQTIMDRNLGATAVYNQNISSPNVTSYGYYYQWGNNYGFPTEGNVTTTPTKVPYSVWSNYVPSKYASGIYVVGSLSSWMDGSINDNMRGGISSNTGDRQGPCPNEYHVPTISEWSSLYNTWYAITPSYVGSTFAYDFLLPSAGFRNYSNGVITYVNNYMDYWSSSPRQGDKTYASILDMRVSNSRIDTARSHLYGLPVRCFKDSINSDTITLHMDGGKNAIIAFTGSVGNGIFTSLGTPQRDASHSFSGWYADAGFNTPVTKGSVVTQDLYAKWSCATYYHDEGGECIYNTKTDNCTPGTVDNGHYVVEPVEITWNEGIKNWNTVACTQLVCDTHYHTGSNNDTCEIDTFTITWKDGNQTLKSETLPYGADPSYSTSKNYYTFLRWDPSIVPVAGDQTYTAVWQANTDANGNNIADEEEPHHTLTIHYVNSKGNEIYPDYTESIVQGADYTIPSQGKLHYIVDTPIVSGTMGTEDVEVTVTYNTETDDTNNNGVADEDEIPHTLTINYVYSRGGKAADSISGKYLELIDYSITSPIIPNYDTNQLVVEGTMPSEDRTITVTYKPTNDDNTNGIADEEEDRYSVVVHYVYTGGRAVTGDQSVVNLLTDQGYNIASPEIQYYTADQAVVSGIIDGESMTGDFIEFTVTYTPNHDANNNGIADEEEKSNSSNYSGRGRKGESATNMHNSADDEKDPAQPITSNDDKQSVEINESTKNPESEMNTENYDSRYTPEQHSAYQFAKSHGITTTVSIREAKMNTPLTRIEMAKMLSYYAMNVMNKQPDMSIGMIKFVDVPSKLDAKYDNGVTLAYQLGIMGINMPENKFRPNDRVTRAEFATALSRMIYGMEDGKGRVKYYEPHIARLYNEGIINNTNPKLQEQRGYVMTMLMRSIK